jgi:4-amino-4-deoxy-L-arabinose transferase-like glycosyltransferase
VSSAATFDDDLVAEPEPGTGDAAFLRRLILAGFALRVVLVLALEWTGFSRNLAPDEETYALEGWQLALWWSGETFVRPWRLSADQPMGYFYLNGAFFWLFGQTQIPLKILNALVGAYSCRYLFLLARDLYGGAVARRAALLFEFFPSLVLWSTVNIRDVWVLLFILFISYKSHQVVRGYSHLALAQVLAVIYLLSHFRDYLFFVVALPPVVSLLLGSRRQHFLRNVLLAGLASLFLLVLVQQGGAVRAGTASRMSLEAISEVRRDMATGGSAFHGQVDVSSPAKALAFLPLGVAYFLFSPFPWQITSTLKLFSVPEMLLFYGLTPAMVRGVAYLVRARLRDNLQVLLLTGLLTVSYALGEGNVGTLYRHRAQALGFLICFAALGVQLKRSRAAVLEPVA